MTIEELNNSLESLKGEVDGLKSRIEDQGYTIKNHQHNNLDDTAKLSDTDFILKPSRVFISGPGGIVGEATKPETPNTRRLYVVCGPEGINNGVFGSESKNMELVLDYNDYNPSSLNLFYGFSKGITGTSKDSKVSITSTQTVLTDSTVDFGDDNSRVGQFLVLATDVAYGYIITANTKHSVTFTPAAGFDGMATYMVYKPVLLGSGTIPWGKIYTVGGTNGGVRFGMGTSYNGQNALLYMDSDGTLKYKKLNGDVITIGGADTLDSLSDVNLTSPSDKQVLLYDASESEWINGMPNTVGMEASDALKASADTERSYRNYADYEKKKEIVTYLSGVVRVKFDIRNTVTHDLYGRVYVNDVAIGTEHSTTSTSYVTFSDDIVVGSGDKIQLYTHTSSDDDYYIRNFRLYYDKVFTNDYNVTLD
ncbi:MAG: Ig-like domain-containing protein [Candidatus Heimdallarchaeaceae archaeon]